MDPHAIDTPRFVGFVRELARLPITTANLIAAHQPTADGLCRGCTRGGTGQPHRPWPCTLNHVATAAARVAANSHRPHWRAA